jgi:ribonucleoside-diphosphate reductase alpha chain
MMATLRCDHPDIEAFVDAKRDPARLRMFNVSVLVTDAFRRDGDAPWELKFSGTTFKVLRARDLWDKIMRATYAYAEPGVIFIDRINRRNNLNYCETISATNPCGGAAAAALWRCWPAGVGQSAALANSRSDRQGAHPIAERSEDLARIAAHDGQCHGLSAAPCAAAAE